MKIVTVIGARPQFVKAGVVSAAIVRDGSMKEVVVHTGQHFDPEMSAIFFDELGMTAPAHFLGIHGGGHGAMTGRMLIALEELMDSEAPDAVLVYGDTNSTLAGALVAAKMHIPVAHVEAGLRSFNLKMPEEINRILTDRVSRWLFTPTVTAAANLRREGVADSAIIPVGDVMFDVALEHGARIEDRAGALIEARLEPNKYVLATVHRAENTDNPAKLRAIVCALQEVSRRVVVVWLVHPRTKQALAAIGLGNIQSEGLKIMPPAGYLDMLLLEKHAAVIATDSGGVQKEAFFQRVPCVTLRDETEWVELIESGWNRLAPPISADVVAQSIFDAIGTSGRDVQPFGDGRAAEAIVARLRADMHR